MKRNLVLILAIVLCISLYIQFPCICEAAPVWSDNFDDGNYDGWTALNGTFSAGDHTLKSIGGGGLIIYPSSAETGTWSFDILGVNDTYVGFMSTYPVPISTTTCLGIWRRWRIGFSVPRLSLHEVTRGSEGTVSWYFFTHEPSGWQHIDVTRDSEGRVYLYLNGTLLMDKVLTGFTSQYFCVYFGVNSWPTIGNLEGAIDNIVVSNTIDIQPPPVPFYQQTWFLPAVVGVVAAGVLGMAFFMRARR